MRTFAMGVSALHKATLKQLADHKTRPAQYQRLMYALGEMLGERIAQKARRRTRALLVCTAEDADYLANGIVQALTYSVKDLKFACLWNFRTRPRGVTGLGIDLDVAPIVKRYEEPTGRTLDFVIVAKSVISTACVVRHNLLDLLEEKKPSQIFIAAPVIYKGADETLRRDFPKNISRKFNFVYFAADDRRDERGMLVPGIGGDVYRRLGFATTLQRRLILPEIVRDRRSRYVASH
jgi:hypothetical protein